MYHEFDITNLKPGESLILYENPNRKKYKKLNRFLGLSLLVLSLILIAVNLGPMAMFEMGYRFGAIGHDNVITLAPNTTVSRFGELLYLNEKGIIASADNEFSLIIPKIGVNSRVIANVDPTNEIQYQKALKTGLAHARDTSFPDQEGLTYIFGHSVGNPWEVTYYNAVFYLLPKLEVNDEIIVVYKGKNYLYQVTEKKVTSAEDVSYLVSDSKEKLLVLQTCWPPGTLWQRMVIIAKPVSGGQDLGSIKSL
jgi:LPXTG-site transpeptidase (sortase) family protein